MSKLNFDAHIQRAADACLAHDYDLAVKVLEPCLKADPENVQILNELGRVHVSAGNDEKAEKYFERACELDAANFTAMNNLGSIYRRLGRNEDSVEVLKRAFSVATDTVAIYYNLGQTYKAMKRYEDAISCFETVLETNPSDVLAHNHLGCIYIDMEEYDQALDMFGRALLIDPNHPIIHFNAAVCYEALNRNEDALRFYENALRKKPGWTEAMLGYSTLLYRMGDEAEAEKVLREAIKRTSRNADLHASLGDLLLKKKKYIEADTEFDKALSLDEENITAVSGKITVLDAQNRSDEAYAMMQKMEKLVPDNPKLSLRCAQLLINRNDYNEAYKRLNLVLQKEPENPDALCLMGEYSLVKGDDASAQNYFNRAIKKDPRCIDYRFDAAKRLGASNNYEAAEMQMRYYISEKPKDDEAWLYLGKIYNDMGEVDNAVKVLHKAQELNPGNPELITAANRLKKTFPGNTSVEGLLQGVLGGTAGDTNRLDTLEESISAYEKSVEQVKEDEDFEKNLRLLAQSEDVFGGNDAAESVPLDVVEENVDGSEEPEAEELPNYEERPQSLDTIAEDEDFSFGDDGFDDLRNSTIEEDAVPMNFDEVEEDFGRDDDFDSMVLGSGDDVPIDIDPNTMEQPFDPSNPFAANRADDEMTVMEAEEVMDLEDAPPPKPLKPPVQSLPNPPYPTPPYPQYPPYVPPYPQYPQYAPPPMPRADPRANQFAVDAAFSQALDNRLMELAEKSSAEESDHSSAEAKRREMQEAIRRALDKLREKSEETVSPKDESIADMFSYVRGLCNYLPQPKKTLFMSSEERMRLEYIITKLRGRPGLFDSAAEVVKTVEETGESSESFIERLDSAPTPAQMAQTLSQEEISDTIMCLQNLARDNMQDKELATALVSKVRNVLSRFDEAGVEWKEGEAPQNAQAEGAGAEAAVDAPTAGGATESVDPADFGVGESDAFSPETLLAEKRPSQAGDDFGLL